MRLILQILSLSDRYERKTRLLPGLIAASTPAIVAMILIFPAAHWTTFVGSGVGIELLLAFILGQLARARGKALEELLWKAWGGPPTTRWLRPWDEACSDQQKVRWRSAIKQLTGLTLPAKISDSKTETDIDRIIGDATRQLRYAIREKPEARMVTIHNEDYGFARNLLGLRWYWVGLTSASAVASLALLFFGEPAAYAVVVSVISVVVAILCGVVVCSGGPLCLWIWKWRSPKTSRITRF